MLENIRHVITSLTMDQLISKLSAHITSRYRQFYHYSVAMATTVT